MLRIIVLLSGAATMALQMAIVRLLAPATGASTVVWATVIGLSLLAMSMGYVIGGRMADRSATARPLAAVLFAAAALVAAIPLLAPRVLDATTNATLAYAALALVPAVLLGVTPPYAIRLAMRDVSTTGRSAGGVYATSTIGSIVGTLLAALVLVQWIGTRATLWAVAGAIVLAALTALQARLRIVHTRMHDVEDAPASVAVLGIATAVLVVLVEGITTMGSEMSIARLAAPFYGASHAVWAVLIATVLGSIVLGSLLGGRIADRHPTSTALTLVLGASATSVALLPFATAPVMRASTGSIDDAAVGVVIGTLLATLALVAIPMTLLGAIPPWVLRLAVPSMQRSGRTTGLLYAASTVGALVGTFASVLWLIPTIGTRRTLLLLALLLALTPLAWMRRMPRRVLAAAVVAPMLLTCSLLAAPTGLVKPPSNDDRVLDERESHYQFIQTVEEPSGVRLLQLNEGWAVHSVWDPSSALTGGVWDQFLVVPSLVRGEGRSMLVIGSAAGTSQRAFAAYRPEVAMTSVELDPEVTAVGRTLFHLKGPVTTADGRPFLERTHARWDVIHVDAYRQPYIPFYLTTREFFALVRSRLHPGGVASINVGSPPDDQRIVDAVAATMRSEFAFVGRYRAEDYSEVVFGIDEPGLTTSRLVDRLQHSNVPHQQPDLAHLYEGFEVGMHEVQPNPDLVMTDDRAPVEWYTDRMIFGAARG